MDRKTVTIRNKDLMEYITLESRRKKVSASKLMEEMILESLSSRTEKGREIAISDTILVDPLKFYITTQDTGELYSSRRIPLHVDFNVFFPFFDVFDIHSFESCKIEKSNKLDSLVKANYHKKQIKDVEFYLAHKFNHPNKNFFCIPIALLHSPNVFYIQSLKDEEILPSLYEIDNKLKNMLMEKNNITDRLKGILHEIKTLVDAHEILIKIISDGELLPFYVEKEKIYDNRFIELLNIKYTRYKDIDELSIIGEKLCLLKGRYGYLYCGTRKYPYSFDDLKSQYLSAIKKDDVENIDKKLDEWVVKFSIPEPIKIANKSKVITMLIDIMKKIKSRLRE
ncbi:hypothetical protein [Citrobacter sp. JGM124]|uniref:hypothetical protein n=1 Tax=Citrobacter sp. JGM124 TaxID=2799789 RepID=UPI001BA4AD23|nr:hypothetical protein [Citrobacter sp. JGM124]MBS0849686.1 hypothetical protein [Citrobacter sp. JGM124]